VSEKEMTMKLLQKKVAVVQSVTKVSVIQKTVMAMMAKIMMYIQSHVID
jgi:hypothetical protein